MDKITQIAKTFNGIQKNLKTSLTRVFKNLPIIEQGRDYFDSTLFYQLEFKTLPDISTITLDLSFTTFSQGLFGCGGCYCGYNEIFTGSDIILTTTYVIVSTPYVIYNDTIVTNWTQTGPREITLGFVPSGVIKVAYIYQIEGCP